MSEYESDSELDGKDFLSRTFRRKNVIHALNINDCIVSEHTPPKVRKMIKKISMKNLYECLG